MRLILPLQTASLANSDYFGSPVAPIGDLDGDGFDNITVGVRGDDGCSGHGTIHIMFMVGMPSTSNIYIHTREMDVKIIVIQMNLEIILLLECTKWCVMLIPVRF